MAKEDETKMPAKLREHTCIVHRLNVEKDNADLAITVNVVGYGRRVFDPGKKVRLNVAQIEVLRNAKEENEIRVPRESAVYDSGSPLKMAETNFPGFRARMDRETGDIILSKTQPNYAVEVLDGNASNSA